jgi:hypothetical protein
MYQVVRVAKLKTAGEVHEKAAHNLRRNEDGSRRNIPQANPQLEKHNSNELAGTLDQAMARWRDALPEKVQKNAVLATEVVLSASSDFADADTKRGRQEWQKLLEDQVDFFKERHGEENVLSVAYHYDETTPHAHVLLIPKHERELKSGVEERLSHKHWYGGREKLSQLQTDVHQAVTKHHGLERGISKTITRANHQDVRRYRGLVSIEKETKKNTLAKAQQERAAVENRTGQERVLSRRVDQLEEMLGETRRERDDVKLELGHRTAERDQARAERDRARDDLDTIRGQVIALARANQVPRVSSEIQREWMQSGKAESAYYAMDRKMRQHVEQERGRGGPEHGR